MKISPAALAAAKQLTGEKFPVVWYVPPGQPVVIGYGVFPQITIDKRRALGVEVILLDNPDIKATCTYVRHQKDESLFWITVQQSTGPVCYKWTDSEDKVQRFIACADNEPDTKDARAATLKWTNRRQIVWWTMHKTGRPLHVVDQAIEAADKSTNLVIGTFRLLDLLETRHAGDVAAVTKEVEALQAGSPEDPDLKALFAQARISTTKPQAVVAILRSAIRAQNALDRQ